MNENYLDGYPYSIFTSVALLDGKVVSYKIGKGHWETATNITFRLNGDIFSRIHEVEVLWKEFLVSRDGEHEKIFEEDAPNWINQWVAHEWFNGMMP